MATVTLGTLTTSGLTALQIVAGSNSAADLATIRNLITNDVVQPVAGSRPIWPGALENGRLSVPNRGLLTLLQSGVLGLAVGDWVAVDSVTGVVVLIPGTVLPTILVTTGITQSGSAVVSSLATAAPTMGWVAGMAIAGSNFSAGTIIESISPGGSSITLSLTVGASSAAATMTAGGPFTHS